MVKYSSILLIFALFANASNVPIEVEQAIAEALKGKWIFNNFEKTKRSMGFDSTIKLTDISPGEPFQMFSIGQHDFEEARDDIPVDSLLKPGNWYVPLYVRGAMAQTVMVISDRFGEKEKWSAGMCDYGQLAKMWSRIKEAWPESKGFHPKLVWILQPMDGIVCFCIPEKGPDNLTIIGSLYLKFKPLKDGVSYTELSSSKETIQGIKARNADRRKTSDSLWKVKKRINDSLAILKERATEHLWKKYEAIEPPMPESAVVSWWDNRLVEADEAIIPRNMSKKELKAQKPEKFEPVNSRRFFSEAGEGIALDSQTLTMAQPLRVGDKPIDRTISKGHDDWYVLFAQDGPGFIRIGSTGPLLFMDAPYKEGQKWGLGGACCSTDEPKNGAEIVEISALSPSDLALRWSVEKAFLKIRSENAVPVHYRISFVAEMSEKRIGSYGPGGAAVDYLMAAANGNIVELYRTTRIRFTAGQAMELRKSLFGTKEIVQISAEHRRPDALEPNAEGELHVQHLILSAGGSGGKLMVWAFEVICAKRNGLWLVAKAYSDPALSQKQVEDIVKQGFEGMAR
jgi:hypothetical protein